MCDCEPRELNAACAREVMQWESREVHVPGEHDEPATVVAWAWMSDDATIEAFQEDWNPTESWADAGRVLERMGAGGWWYTIDDYPGGGAIVRFQDVGTETCGHGTAVTPTVAIVRAALAAVRGPIAAEAAERSERWDEENAKYRCIWSR